MSQKTVFTSEQVLAHIDIPEEDKNLLEIVDTNGNLFLVKTKVGYRTTVIERAIQRESSTPVTPERMSELESQTYPLDKYDSGILYYVEETNVVVLGQKALKLTPVRQSDFFPHEQRMTSRVLPMYFEMFHESLGQLRQWYEGTVIFVTCFPETYDVTTTNGDHLKYLVSSRRRMDCTNGTVPDAKSGSLTFFQMLKEGLPRPIEDFAQPGHTYMFCVIHPNNQMLNDPKGVEPRVIHLRTYRFDSPEGYMLLDEKLEGFECTKPLTLQQAILIIRSGGVVMTDRPNNCNIKLMLQETGTKYDMLQTPSNNILMTWYDIKYQRPADLPTFMSILHGDRLEKVQQEEQDEDQIFQATTEYLFQRNKLKVSSPKVHDLMETHPQIKACLWQLKAAYVQDKSVFDRMHTGAHKRFILGGSHKAAERITRERIEKFLTELRGVSGHTYYQLTRKIRRFEKKNIKRQEYAAANGGVAYASGGVTWTTEEEKEKAKLVKKEKRRNQRRVKGDKRRAKKPTTKKSNDETNAKLPEAPKVNDRDAQTQELFAEPKEDEVASTDLEEVTQDPETENTPVETNSANQSPRETIDVEEDLPQDKPKSTSWADITDEEFERAKTAWGDSDW